MLPKSIWSCSSPMVHVVHILLLLVQLSVCRMSGEWISHGGDLGNRRYAEDEHQINVATAPALTRRWRYFAGADISATPAIYEGVVFAPSWNGLVFAVTVEGAPVWQVNLTEATGFNGTLSRTTPAVTKEVVVLGLLGPARVVALFRRTGRLAWISPELDETPLSRITMSGTAFKGAFYVGISSIQELVETACCTFQGSFQKLDLRTGRRIWRTYMVPQNSGFTGVAVWGSSPSVDPKRGLVYIATGNLYTVPQDIQNCLDNNDNSSDCIPASVCDDAVVAIDMKDGSVRWCNRLGGNDVWRLACVVPNPPPNCPATPGPDYDFGEAPVLLTVPWNHTKLFRDIVVTGQKSGIVWAHDRTTGELHWRTVAGPGGSGGGAIWGAATDNYLVYTNIANSNAQRFQLFPSEEVTTAGGWVAMHASTGRIIWSTANPTGGRAFGPVTIANGVLFVGSFDEEGHVYGLNAKTGDIIWEGLTGATVYGGLSVGLGCAFVGSGYALAPLGPAFNGTPGDSLFAFCLKTFK